MSAIENTQPGQFGPQGQQSYGQRVRTIAANPGAANPGYMADIKSRAPVASAIGTGIGTVAAGAANVASHIGNAIRVGLSDDGPGGAAESANDGDRGIKSSLDSLHQKVDALGAGGGYQHPLASLYGGAVSSGASQEQRPALNGAAADARVRYAANRPSASAMVPQNGMGNVNPRASVPGGLNVQRNSAPVTFGGQGMAVSQGDRIRAQGSLGTRRQGLGVNSVPSQNGIGNAQARSQEMQSQQGGG